MDALNYYEKVEDYESIVSILWKLYERTSYDLSLYVIGIFERAPAKVFGRVDFFAAMHLHTLLCLNRLDEFNVQAKRYEKKLLSLPKDDSFRNNTLGGVYFFWGYMRFLMSATDDNYDFDVYLAKAADCLIKSSAEHNRTLVAPLGPWGSAAGSAKTGAPQKFVDAAARLMNYTPFCFNSARGLDDLCRGELKFYQGEIRAAELLFIQALEQGQRCRQFETIHRALFYIMRIAIAQGDRTKVEQMQKDTAALLEEENYSRRFITYDITLGLYACAIHQFEMIPNWLKGKFTPYSHAYFIENFGNQIKARYCYLTKNYHPLLSYIRELKQRESILYGRIEMLAMEACIHYKMKNIPAAIAALQTAYETASPNNIKWPFIELGKDMNTLTRNALKADCNIPHEWLKNINRKASSYAKQHSSLISNYNNKDGITALSPRESEILSSLHNGLSRPEVANNLGLSLNTINSAVIRIYSKLSASNIADAVRIATEHKLV
jgi:DNA-binding CsgD family transcriptional regulator